MDIRVYGSKRRIVDGLFDCLKEKPLKEVLNQDIIKKAEISSRTFYRYYSDKNEIVDEFEKAFIDGLNEALEKDREVLANLDHKPNKEEIFELADVAFQNTLKFCIPFKEQGKIMLSKNGDIKFLWMIREAAEAEFGKRKKMLYGENVTSNPFIERLYVGEIILTIETWLSYDDELSPQQIRTLIGQVQVMSPAELLELGL